LPPLLEREAQAVEKFKHAEATGGFRWTIKSDSVENNPLLKASAGAMTFEHSKEGVIMVIDPDYVTSAEGKADYLRKSSIGASDISLEQVVGHEVGHAAGYVDGCKALMSCSNRNSMQFEMFFRGAGSPELQHPSSKGQRL
jgi:hypothetical protein